MAAVDEKVKQIIVEQLGVDEGEVTQNASFVDDLGADSLDTVELVMAFEEAFEIEIPDEDAEKIRTVQDAVDYIGKHTKGGKWLARRVVVTGIGLICGVGNTTEEIWRNLLAGKSGVARITHFDATQFACQIAAEVKNFDPLNFVEKKELKKMGRFIYLALAAADEAMKASGLQVAEEISTRTGVHIGSGIGGFDVIEREHINLLNGGPRKISPFFIPASIVNLAAGHVSIRYNAKGPNEATCTACTSSAHSIGDAYKIIARCDADVMIAGGTEKPRSPLWGLAVLPPCAPSRLETMHPRKPAVPGIQDATDS